MIHAERAAFPPRPGTAGTPGMGVAAATGVGDGDECGAARRLAPIGEAAARRLAAVRAE
jgi:hypothetical protein